jgi:hypothetical protein
VPPIDYLVLRTLRRMAPQKVVDWMLDRGVYLRPGRDTRQPEASVQAYCDAAARAGQSITGKRVLVFGYGGSLGVALGLLEAGARHVCLQDPFAPVRIVHHRALPADRMTRFFRPGPRDWQPDPDRVTIVREALPDLAARGEAMVDWIVSNSVFEHVADVEANVAACARLTRPSGISLHRIDLRDHFFKYPFEMLCYSDRIWARWLNAGNNLNRWRLPQYLAVFARYFDDVKIEVVRSLPAQFALAKPRIRPGFLSGDDALDATALIAIEAQRPAPGQGPSPRGQIDTAAAAAGPRPGLVGSAISDTMDRPDGRPRATD